MNPMNLIMQMMRGGNPNDIIKGLMSNNQIMGNPMARNVVQMMKDNDQKGLQRMAENMCKEKGINMEQMKQDLINRFGMK